MSTPKEETSDSIVQHMRNKIKEETELMLTKKLEKEFRNKYAKNKGKDIKLTLYCTACGKNYTITRKNNKSDTTRVQMCPHTIFESWEIKH